MDVGDGNLTVHLDMQGTADVKRIRHIYDLWVMIAAALSTRGMPHVDTWVYAEDDRSQKFVEFLGFEETGFLKIIPVNDVEHVMKELRYQIPLGD